MALKRRAGKIVAHRRGQETEAQKQEVACPRPLGKGAVGTEQGSIVPPPSRGQATTGPGRACWDKYLWPLSPGPPSPAWSHLHGPAIFLGPGLGKRVCHRHLAPLWGLAQLTEGLVQASVSGRGAPTEGPQPPRTDWREVRSTISCLVLHGREASLGRLTEGNPRETFGCSDTWSSCSASQTFLFSKCFYLQGTLTGAPGQ